MAASDAGRSSRNGCKRADLRPSWTYPRDFRALAPIHLAARVRPEPCLFLRDLPTGALATVLTSIRCRVSVLLAFVALFTAAAVSAFAASAGADPRGSLTLLRVPAFAATFRALAASIGFFSESRVLSAFPSLLSGLPAAIFSWARLPAFLGGGMLATGGGAISIPNSAATSSSAKMRLLKAPV